MRIGADSSVDMDFVLPGAVSLARALLTLSRAEQSGVLLVSSGSERFQLVLDAGVIRAVRGADGDRHALGDGLMRVGALDCVRYSEALAKDTPSTPIGAWLVRNGCTTPAAVEYVLRAQMRERVKRILLSRGLEYQFVRQTAQLDDAWLETPFTAADLVLFGMRELFAERDLTTDLAPLPAGPLTLSSLGQSLVRGATLWPEELVVVELLKRGADLKRITAAIDGHPRGLGFVVLAHVLGAITVGEARHSQYALLLRKLRQSRQAATASTLLGLSPASTDTEARRALQKLAGHLHPDTLGPHAPDELRAASHEVMAALNAAEQRLRRSGLRR